MIELIQRQQTPKAEEVADHIIDKQLIEDCLAFVKAQKDCAGMASNQLMSKHYRINKRFFFCIQDLNKNEFLTFLNPKILEYRGRWRMKEERCLSWGLEKEDRDEYRIYARRWEKIVIAYDNMAGESVVGEIEGLPAQIYQHNLDHLNGVKEKFINDIEDPKPLRNEPCFCGSGRKYKRCCGAVIKE